MVSSCGWMLRKSSDATKPATPAGRPLIALGMKAVAPSAKSAISVAGRVTATMIAASCNDNEDREVKPSGVPLASQ